ncbi:MAG: hypothetical protein ABEH38_04050 [Flavobacteriales bacterium]
MQRPILFFISFLFLAFASCSGEKGDTNTGRDGSFSSSLEAKLRLSLDTLFKITASVEGSSMKTPQEIPLKKALQENPPPPLRMDTTGVAAYYRAGPYHVIQYQSLRLALRAFKTFQKRTEEPGKGTPRLRGSASCAMVQGYLLFLQLPCEPSSKEIADARAWRKWIASLGEPSGHFYRRCPK